MKSLDLGARDAGDEPTDLPVYAALSYAWNDPITIYQEPAGPIVDNPKNFEEYARSPYVWVITGPSSLILHTDFALKSYLKTHPYLPKEKPQPSPDDDDDDDSEMRPIEVDGHLLYIQANLHDFLQHFHHLKFDSDFAHGRTPGGEDDTGRHLRKCVMAPLWIDAVCINQADAAERAS